MSQELATLIGEQQFSIDDFKQVAKTAFTPRLTLFGGNSKLVKKGKIPVGTWGLPEGSDEAQDLGKTIDAFVLAFRPKAIEGFNDDEIMVYYDPKSEAFKRVMASADAQDSGMMFGPEFLLYLPSEKKFVHYFMGGKTSRNASHKMFDNIGGCVTLGIELIEAGKFSWHGPKIQKNSSPPQVDLNPEDVQAHLIAFRNPKDGKDGAVVAGSPDAAARER